MRFPLILLALCLTIPAFADGPEDNVATNVRPIPPKGIAVPDAVAKKLRAGLAELEKEIDKIDKDNELLPDVLIYHKAVDWALKYDQFYKPAEFKQAEAMLQLGMQRAKDLQEGKHPWTSQTGLVVRAYRSIIDGSIQPYGLVIPKSYKFDGEQKHRLDFWWHGRGETLSELAFIQQRQTDPGQFTPPDTIVVHPYGRYCNANKFAGEVDSFEVMADVAQRYRIDPQRIAARGFSMGGASCWQFAVHFPTWWAAAAPGAGFAETPEFLKVFQNENVSPPWYEKRLWHWYNATDYALNLYNLPVIAYSGEIDKQKQAADVMQREAKKLGLEFPHIIGPNTAHKYEPGAKKELQQRFDKLVANARPKLDERDTIKFVTYTLRYNSCGWISVQGLQKHWERSEVLAHNDDGNITIATKGITSLSIYLDNIRSIKIDEQEVIPVATQFNKIDGKWTIITNDWSDVGKKSTRLKGPIDDAFMSKFLFVRPTGSPLSKETGDWVQAEMQHAIDFWQKQFRGEVPIKNDVDVTEDDIDNCNLILWGDAQSNKLIPRIEKKLPIEWRGRLDSHPTRPDAHVINGYDLVMGDTFVDARTHIPIMIYPNPLNKSQYIVLNSGVTYREYDALNNARQTPKLPDYAIVDITTPPNSRSPGKIVRAGFFDENWQLQKDDGQ